MNIRFILPSLALALLPALAWADRNPDFEGDAKPILNQQPGLVQYIHAHFVVQETGLAKFPGTNDQPPRPPFIFSAKPRGAAGPFYLRLLIQPGPDGHILKVADVRNINGQQPPQEPAPETASQPPGQPPIPQQPSPSTAPSPSRAGATPPTASPTSTPTSDTPSGPIPDSGSSPAPSSTSGSPDLAPPPDPAPATP